jgi:hypothetical protein
VELTNTASLNILSTYAISQIRKLIICPGLNRLWLNMKKLYLYVTLRYVGTCEVNQSYAQLKLLPYCKGYVIGDGICFLLFVVPFHFKFGKVIR